MPRLKLALKHWLAISKNHGAARRRERNEKVRGCEFRLSLTESRFWKLPSELSGW